jgi:hypothetical protein
VTVYQAQKNGISKTKNEGNEIGGKEARMAGVRENRGMRRRYQKEKKRGRERKPQKRGKEGGILRPRVDVEYMEE